ncbi:hypothetical protein AB0425_02285 [Actinosynnema sp. NPDC051121]
MSGLAPRRRGGPAERGKAAEQLGHERFAVRLAGVHAMVGLADDWPAQRQTCVNVLCGYLRTPYPTDDPTEREVRQEIITTLLDHVWDQRWNSRTVDLDFRGVEFEDLDLSQRTFRGNFHFDNALDHRAADEAARPQPVRDHAAIGRGGVVRARVRPRTSTSAPRTPEGLEETLRRP